MAGTHGLQSGCVRAHPTSLTGTIQGAGRAQRGHRLRSVFEPPTNTTNTTNTTNVDVLIVGAGVAGLTAAWRLRREGFGGEILLMDLGDTIGGTSAAGKSDIGAFPWGAHYITLPNREARHMRALLHDLGVIQGFDGAGRPKFDPGALCLAPQERLYIYGEWIHGLWPEVGANADDTAQHRDFLAQCAAWESRVGADGRPAFSIPVHHSSNDPEIRALAIVSFDAWLTAQGYTSDRLRWWLTYGCLDDFGTTLEQTSAWAGLHYHCARRPEAADARDMGTHVLTWPAGNGWLVNALAERAHATTWTGALVRRIEADTGRVWVEVNGDSREVKAKVVICAVQSRIADLLVDRKPTSPRADFAPWCVAQLHCDALPKSRGVAAAWDSVIYGSDSLGVVSSAHQLGRYGGPTVLTWYKPIIGETPSQAARALMRQPWEETADIVMTELAQAHEDLRSRVQKLDVWHWGHGTARPVVGLHTTAALSEAAKPVGRVHFAHTDLSGMSLFEEASWHGVRAAEEALPLLDIPVVQSLL